MGHHLSISEKRDHSADFAKAILILIVIIGHAIQFGSGSEYYSEGAYWENKLVQAICSFHMPCFMLISGFFHYGSVERNGGFQSLLKRIKKLIPPLACWAPFFLIGGVLIGRYSLSAKRLLICFLTDFWFLWAILFCTIITTGLLYLPLKVRWIISALLIVGMTLPPDFLLVPATYKWLFIYFIVGYMIADKMSGAVPKIKPLIGIGAMIIWAGMLFFYNKSMFIYTTGWSILFPSSGNNIVQMILIDLFRSAIAFFGIIGFLWICQTFYAKLPTQCWDTKLGKFIMLVGRKTLPIYMIQMVIFEFGMVALTGNLKHNILIIAVESFAVLMISIAITCVLEKNKVTKRAFLGL